MVPLVWPSRGSGKTGAVDAGLLAIADAEEPGAVGVLLIVEAEVTLVGVVGEGDLSGEVVLGQTTCREASSATWLWGSSLK